MRYTTAPCLTTHRRMRSIQAIRRSWPINSLVELTVVNNASVQYVQLIQHLPIESLPWFSPKTSVDTPKATRVYYPVHGHQADQRGVFGQRATRGWHRTS